MRVPTEARIRELSPAERARLRLNANRLGGELGAATIALLDTLQLNENDGGMALDHPLYIEMRGIAQSAEGRAVAVKAVDDGLPALAGIDVLLQATMGSRYRSAPQATKNSGYIAAELMRQLGYEETGEGPLPAGCVAKKGLMWRPKKPPRKPSP